MSTVGEFTKESASFANLAGSARAIQRGLSPQTVAKLKTIALSPTPLAQVEGKQIPTGFSRDKEAIKALLAQKAKVGYAHSTYSGSALRNILNAIPKEQDLSKLKGLNRFSLDSTKVPFNRDSYYLKRKPRKLKEQEALPHLFLGKSVKQGPSVAQFRSSIYY